MEGMPAQIVRGSTEQAVGAIRGALLAAGTVDAGPDGLMLAIACPSAAVAQALIGAFRRAGLPSPDRQSVQARNMAGGRLIVNQRAEVSGLLTRIGAAAAAEVVRRGDLPVAAPPVVRRQLAVANRDRSAKAADTAVTALTVALQNPPDDTSGHLLEVGRLRLAHPELSLLELGRRADPPLTKDAVAGRLRRLLLHLNGNAEPFETAVLEQERA